LRQFTVTDLGQRKFIDLRDLEIRKPSADSIPIYILTETGNLQDFRRQPWRGLWETGYQSIFHEKNRFANRGYWR
jgi:hypothetical protein